MSVGTCQLRHGVIWNADDCRRAEARIERLERVAEAARAMVQIGIEWSATGAVSGVGACPVCGGYDPAQATTGNPSWHPGYHGTRSGHVEGCEMEAFIAVLREER